MKHFSHIVTLTALFLLTFIACNENVPVDENQRDGFTNISYTESDDLFPNPERGFYSHQGFYTGSTSTLSVSKVKTLRQQNVSLILTIYYMPDFRTQDITDEFLQRLETNMKALRAGGSKCVLRFAYTSSEDDKPWDASQDQVIRHINQLAPYLQEYADVIYCMEAGFVGVWGEWYYTDNFVYNPTSLDDYAPRRAVLDALLTALPSERMICVRTPIFKLHCFGITPADTLTLTTAYNQSDLARIAAHNDCFLASSNDVGTFSSKGSITAAIQRTFWEQETKYTVMGGETCGTSAYSTCENAVEQMAKYHWSYLNANYHMEVLSSWRTDGCMDEITRRLGYRLVLTKGWFTQQPKAGKTFEAELHIKNVGFAAPVNPRDVQLIFVSAADSAEKYISDLTVDPRYWFAGSEYTVKATSTLSATMKGTYAVYLNLPDPEETLADNPDFSIRLANKDVWEAATGYNKLCEITVAN